MRSGPPRSLTRYAAYLEQDGYTYLSRDGIPTVDNTLMHRPIAKWLGGTEVESKQDRHEHAGRFLGLVSTVLPSVPGPSLYEQWEDKDDRWYAEAVWDKAVKVVSAQLQTVSMENLVGGDVRSRRSVG